MKQLIVNADDFGLTEGVNNGIIKTFREGIVTSTSIMANGESFDHAVLLSKQYPLLSIGIHLVLVEEKPVLPPDEIPSLICEKDKFHKNYKTFLFRFLSGRIKRIDVEKELRAQIKKALKAGIQIAHLDSHQHLHIFPAILDIVLRLAQEYGMKWMRNSCDHHAPAHISQRGLAILAKKGKKKMLQKSIRTSDHFLGAGFSGRLTVQKLIRILAKLPDGTSELMCHPGDGDGESTTKYGHWGFNWRGEQEALLAETVKQSIEEKGIGLTSYAELSTTSPGS